MRASNFYVGFGLVTLSGSLGRLSGSLGRLGGRLGGTSGRRSLLLGLARFLDDG